MLPAATPLTGVAAHLPRFVERYDESGAEPVAYPWVGSAEVLPDGVAVMRKAHALLRAEYRADVEQRWLADPDA